VGLVLDAHFPDASGRYFAMGKEAGESRVYGGIRYRIDLEEGFVIARKVSARALQVGVPADRPFVPVGKRSALLGAPPNAALRWSASKPCERGGASQRRCAIRADYRA